MEFQAVYHKTSEQMSYALNENELAVNLKTGYDVEKVYIHYGDPFEAGILGGSETWTGKREEICYKKRLKYQIWWTTTLRPEYKRCKYYFELHTRDEVWYYFEDGFVTKEQLMLDGKMLQCFTVPWMNPADVNLTPSWVNDTVWYQIFPDRFCNGTPEQNMPDIKPWRTGSVTNEERFGGNLSGMIQKLPYLQDLGITGIYLNPIFEADSNHKYDTKDYQKIDPAFGDEARLKAVKPEVYLLGEIWHDASQWLLGDEYDSVMNYPLTGSINDFFLDESLGKEDFEYMINRCYTMYMQQNNNVIFNLLDSHDTDRLINRTKDMDIFFQQLAVLFSMPGSPCIYYGTEVALEGSHDPDCRRCMPWDELKLPENQAKIRDLKQLIRLRRSEDTFKSLHFHFPNLISEKRCVEYIKLSEDGDKTEILLNCCGKEIAVEQKGEILYSRRYEGGILGKNGTLIRRI